MNVNRVIEVRNGDPVGSVQMFLAAWWNAAGLDALLAPVELPDGSGVKAQVVDSPAGLEAVNPFAPIMLSNSASAIGKFSRDHPEGHLAAILRPCELRALVELRKRRHPPAAVDKVVILGVDCTSTLPPTDYAERVKDRGVQQVTRAMMSLAAEGDCCAHRPRTACRVCKWPAPRGADVTLGLIGVPPDEYLLVLARDEATDDRLGLAQVSDGHATEAQVVRREVAVGAIAKKHSRARSEIVKTIPQRFSDLGSLLSWMATCSLCGDCLDACPVYDGELGTLLGSGGAGYAGRPLLAELVDVGRWLASCAGCGMCEGACDSTVPLSLVITALSQRIQDELGYASGDPDHRLPWAVA